MTLIWFNRSTYIKSVRLLWNLICVCFSWRSEEEEEFLVLLEQSPDALELMKEKRDRLQRGEPVRAQLDRQPQAFRPSPNPQHFELPSEFYNLTAEELKKEQQQRYEQSMKLYIQNLFQQFSSQGSHLMCSRNTLCLPVEWKRHFHMSQSSSNH